MTRPRASVATQFVQLHLIFSEGLRSSDSPTRGLTRASPARSGRVARSPCSLAPRNERQAYWTLEPSISRFEMRRLVQADAPTRPPSQLSTRSAAGSQSEDGQQGPSACAVAEKRIFGFVPDERHRSIEQPAEVPATDPDAELLADQRG